MLLLVRALAVVLSWASPALLRVIPVSSGVSPPEISGAKDLSAVALALPRFQACWGRFTQWSPMSRYWTSLEHYEWQ